MKKNLSIIFYLVVFLFSSSIFASVGNAIFKSSQTILSIDETPEVIFQQALNDDLSGKHYEARCKYDVLNTSVLASAVAVPSAVNLAVLGRYAEAGQAFALLQRKGNAREREYARLWDLWLTARTWKGSTTALQKTLTDKADNYKWFSTYETALADFYAGKGSEESVFHFIDSIAFSDAEEKEDAVTQAVFFVGGYYQYAVNQPQKAQKLYRRFSSHLNKSSLERNLILKEQSISQIQ